MKRYIGYFILCFISVGLLSCGDKNKDARQPSVETVSVIKIPTRTVTTYKSYPTIIEGIINVSVRAKISGYITEVLIDEGEKVEKGQLLFKLETHALSEEAEAAKANVNAARVEVDQLKPLVEKNIVGNSQLATAKAKLEQAKSQYQSAMANIGYSEIRSPVEGYAGEIRLRRGNLVSPSDQKPLTVITDISKVYAYFSMNEQDYLDFMEKADGKTREEKIQNLPEVTLIMANGATYPQKGKIQTINSQIDRQTGSISFRAIFDNPNQILTNGSTGEIRMPKTYENMLVVPQQATFERQNKILIMKVVQSGDSARAVSATIDVKGDVRGLYLVESGIEEGDEIVAEDVNKIREGSLIKINEVPFDSIAKPIPVTFFR